MFIIKISLIVLFVLQLFPLKVASASSKLILTTWTKNPLSNAHNTGYLDVFIKKAFKGIDLQVDIVQNPVERSITDANSGLYDGEFIRVSGLSNVYPNLIQVPAKIFNFEFVAFTKNKSIRVDGWSSLKPYRVGIVTGWKILEKNISNVRERSDLSNPESLFKMLDSDRIDVAVYSNFLGSMLIKKLNLKNILVKKPSLATKPMFLYLHKKHKKIIPSLTKKIRELNTSILFQHLK